MRFFSQKNQFFATLPLVFATLVLLFSCSEEAQIRSYYVEPEYEGPVVAWKLPSAWGENPDLSGPMAGSFHVKSESGPVGRIGVMPFRDAVSSLEIANMFGMELGHDRFDEESLRKVTEIKELGGESFEWIRISQREGSENPNTALLAILKKEGETWLFPFVADARLINRELDSFSEFLGSVTVRAGKREIRAIQPSLPQPSRTSSAGAPTWETPKHWKAGKASSMRVGSYSIEDANGKVLDFSITTFPGDVGGLLPNVNRWLEQVGLEAIDENNLDSYLSAIRVDQKDAHLLIAENTAQSVYGALLFGKSQSWFFKLIGDSGLARVEKENFLALLDSVCFHDH